MLDTVGQIVGGLAGLAFVVVPPSLFIWLVLVQTFPEATLLQLSFAFVIVATILILTGLGILAAWLVGAVFIVVVLLQAIWTALG